MCVCVRVSACVHAFLSVPDILTGSEAVHGRQLYLHMLMAHNARFKCTEEMPVL
jgi:hypothetical protein